MGHSGTPRWRVPCRSLATAHSRGRSLPPTEHSPHTRRRVRPGDRLVLSLDVEGAEDIVLETMSDLVFKIGWPCPRSQRVRPGYGHGARVASGGCEANNVYEKRPQRVG